MIDWGVNALNHGHSIAVFKDNILIDNIVGTNDTISSSTSNIALDYGSPDRIFWYENPWLKKIRQLYAGQYSTAFDLSVLPKNNIKSFNCNSITYTSHHASHAAAGYYTSPFNHCAVVVIDAIGEFECATIWKCSHGEMKKMWSRWYPNSLGLFYSAFTKLIGLTPIKDEYVLQNMAEQGDSHIYYDIILQYMNGLLKSKQNMHRGISNWTHPINTDQDRYNIAAAVQRVFENQISMIMDLAIKLTNSKSLVYMGGCAMNSQTNRNIVEPRFKYIWSLPNPGDPSSSIGAVLYHTKQRTLNFNWNPVKHITIKV